MLSYKKIKSWSNVRWILPETGNANVNKLGKWNSVNLNKLFSYYYTVIDKMLELCYDKYEHCSLKHATIGCVLLHGVKNNMRRFSAKKRRNTMKFVKFMSVVLVILMVIMIPVNVVVRMLDTRE